MTTPQELTFWLAFFQGAMVARNLTLYNPPQNPDRQPFREGLSVLIPARNEESNLWQLLQSLRNQLDCEFEVIVLDDNSQDTTFSIAQNFAAQDQRFRIVSSEPLPQGWAGKQFACHQLSLLARFEYWLFLDADVELIDTQALSKIGFALKNSKAGMLSSIPRQITETVGEQMVIPTMHLILLGFLPFWEMRKSRLPALGAACGQMVAVKRTPYSDCGGHMAVKHRLHDAQALATSMRNSGHLTDLFDSTHLAQCRMYSSTKEVFFGFAKNATEGFARPGILPIWTVLLLGANVMPWVLTFLEPGNKFVIGALVTNSLVYWALMLRYHHSFLGTLLRPAGVLLFVAIQWIALFGKLLGWQAEWKGRAYKRRYK